MSQLSLILLLAVVALGVFLLVISAMAVGVMFGRRPISGSCGGLGNRTDADGNTSCSLCSNPSDSCRELGRRMEGEAAGSERREHAESV